MVQFIPDALKPQGPQIPYFEDSSRERGLVGQATEKSISQLQAEIRAAMGYLGGSVTQFIQGTYSEKPRRYGFRITFVFQGLDGRLDVAALPLRRETPSQKEKALKQALYMLVRILESKYHEHLLQPGAIPLAPYLIGRNGQTLSEALVSSGQLPALESGES